MTRRRTKAEIALARLEAQYPTVGNGAVWGIGAWRNGRIRIRKIVWGRLMARSEKRPGEQLFRLTLVVAQDVRRPRP